MFHISSGPKTPFRLSSRATNLRPFTSALIKLEISLRTLHSCLASGPDPPGHADSGPVSKTAAVRLSQVSTIYVGGISFDTDERALQNYFEKYGHVAETKVQIAALHDAAAYVRL